MTNNEIVTWKKNRNKLMKPHSKKTLLMALISVMIMPVALADNMPADVLARVKQESAAQFPGNYSMQKLMIDEHKKSYEFLSTFAPKNVPTDVLQSIKNDTAAQFPDNYGMQKLMVEEQVKSYLELNE